MKSAVTALLIFASVGCAAKKPCAASRVAMKHPFTLEVVGEKKVLGDDGKVHGSCRVVAKGVNASTGATVWFCQ